MCFDPDVECYLTMSYPHAREHMVKNEIFPGKIREKVSKSLGELCVITIYQIQGTVQKCLLFDSKLPILQIKIVHK